MTDFQIIDEGNNVVAKVTSLGELVVASISHSTPYYVSVDTASTAFNVVPGIAGKCFVVTGLLLSSSKTFGTAVDAETLTIYEANPADLDTNLKIIVQVDLLKNDRLPATSLDLLVTQARSLVAIATDTSVDVTVSGYYINVNSTVEALV